MKSFKCYFEIAGNLFGFGSKEQEAVRKGWEDVGITVKKNQGNNAQRFGIL
ncbi:MAG: hypothetical protein H3Z53_10845 [archaeon]|nr:hypothetical protein [archaeon]MCP8314848.1 hypothetical protein [archaeon]